MTDVQTRVTEISDEELMRGVQGDAPEAFGALYDRFARRVYSVVRRIARDSGRAEDVHQETFVSVWRGRASFDPGKGTVSSWILSIARHRAIDTPFATTDATTSAAPTTLGSRSARRRRVI